VHAFLSIASLFPLFRHLPTTYFAAVGLDEQSGFKMQLDLIKSLQEDEMKRKSNRESVCPVARSLDVVGEWWSLLIVRDAMLGVKRFSEFERRLGMAKNILTARLKTLVEAGVLRIVPASDGSAYSEYELTQKGKDLLPTMIALRQWGEKYMFANGDHHSTMIDHQHGKPLEKITVRSADGRELGVEDVDLLMPEEPVKEKRRRVMAAASLRDDYRM
jgi:DNA-binding HxlR family transcriptional regulator